MLKLWFALALKFIGRHKRKTIITGGFIVLGTAILILMQSITTGINDTMVVNTTRLHTGDIYASFPYVSDVTPTLSMIEKEIKLQAVLVRYRSAGMLVNGADGKPIQWFAVDVTKEFDVTAIGQKVISGQLPRPDKKEMLIGKKVADELKLSVGSDVSLLNQQGALIDTISISGIYETGIDHVDGTTGYMSYRAVSSQVLAQADMEISIFTPFQSNLDAHVMDLKTTTGIEFKTWKELMPDLVQLIDLNKASMSMIMLFVYVLVGFGIGNTFILTLMERFKEFGILKAMGVTPKELILLTFLESMVLCTVATLIGICCGAVLSIIGGQVGIDLTSMTSHNQYFVVTGMIFPRMDSMDMLNTGVFAIGISLIASYLPTRMISRRMASESIRFS